MKKYSMFFIVMTAVLAFTMPLQANTLIFDYNIEFSGASMPVSEVPWLRATFDDGGSPGSVTLLLEAIGLDDNDDYVGGWYFNVDGSLEGDIASFSITQVTAPPYDSNPVATSIEQGTNDYKADGDGYYDFMISFSNSNSDGRFENGDSALFKIVYDGITADSFSAYSAPGGGAGVFLSAAHIQSLGSEDQDSGWVAPSRIPVPEPSTLFLLGIGLMGLAGIRRK